MGIVMCRIAVLLVSKTHYIGLFHQKFWDYTILIGIASETCPIGILI